MNSKLFSRAGAALAMLVCGAAAFAQVPPPKFRIGDPAPPLDAMVWIQGEPVKRFEPGHVYVVEFWATWCGPCNAVMPHLSELQKKHAGKLTVIGVNVRESEHAEPEIEKVTAFVKKKGERMAYTVAMDDPKRQPIFEAWMIAGGSYGIPTSFVIDGKGTLVWMGHPLGPNAADFDAAVEQALAGNNDLDKARALQAEVNAATYQRQQEKKTFAVLDAARKRSDHAAVIAEADRLIAESPANAMRVFHHKIGAMLQLDEAGALQTLRAAAEDPEARKQMNAESAEAYLMNVAYAIAGLKGLSNASYQFALECMEKSLAQNPKDPFGWMGVAAMYDRIGKPAQAVEAQKKAIDLASTDAVEKAFVEQMQDTLKAYEAKVSKG